MVRHQKNEIFGVFNRGGFSSTISFKDHFREEIQIRKDNNQSIILIQLLKFYKVSDILKSYF